jgi:hypothetical protein
MTAFPGGRLFHARDKMRMIKYWHAHAPVAVSQGLAAISACDNNRCADRVSCLDHLVE